LSELQDITVSTLAPNPRWNRWIRTHFWESLSEEQPTFPRYGFDIPRYSFHECSFRRRQIVVDGHLRWADALSRRNRASAANHPRNPAALLLSSPYWPAHFLQFFCLTLNRKFKFLVLLCNNSPARYTEESHAGRERRNRREWEVFGECENMSAATQRQTKAPPTPCGNLPLVTALLTCHNPHILPDQSPLERRA